MKNTFGTIIVYQNALQSSQIKFNQLKAKPKNISRDLKLLFLKPRELKRKSKVCESMKSTQIRIKLYSNQPKSFEINFSQLKLENKMEFGKNFETLKLSRKNNVNL